MQERTEIIKLLFRQICYKCRTKNTTIAKVCRKCGSNRMRQNKFKKLKK